METLDVIKAIGLRLGAGQIPTTIHAFSFQSAKEAFSDSMVRAATDGTRAAHEVVTFQEALVRIAGKLSFPLRV